MNSNNNFTDFRAAISADALKQLKDNSTWYLLLGIALVVLGTFALYFSVFTTIFSVIYLGIFLFLVGIFQAVKSFKINKWGTFLWYLFLSLLYIVSGVFIALNPLANAFSLTLLLAAFFVVVGILRIVFSFSSLATHKFWMAANGLLSIALGVLIWSQWPISSLWVIGTFVAIDAIFTGFTWIILSIKAKKIGA